jgi:tetratricopeptide (TPR) repeat protein
MLINFQCDRRALPEEVLRARIDSFIDVAKEKNIKWLEARMESLGGIACFRKWDNYELAFRYFTQLYQSLQRVSIEEFPEKQICYYQIGIAYYDFGDLDNAIKYMKEGLRETPKPVRTGHKRLMLNTIALSYQTKGQLDSAELYFNRALQAKLGNEEDRPWEGIIKGNLGYNEYLRHNYTAAKPLIQADIDDAMHFEDWGLAAGALTTMAAIHWEEGNIAQAQAEADSARRYIGLSGQYKRLARLFPLMSKLQSAKGNYKLAALYLDSTLIVKDSLANQLNALLIVRGRQKAELEAKDDMEKERAMKTMQRNFLLGFIVLLLPFTIYIYFQQRRKFMQQQKIKDLQLEKKHTELEFATQQLGSYARQISEKEKLVQELEGKIGSTENAEFLLQLQQSTILTDEDWVKFKQLFDQVHVGFSNRLQEKLPSLSPAEKRFMVLAKLKFSNREMAAALGVSAQSIRVTRHRLLKKINLPEDSSLDELVGMI